MDIFQIYVHEKVNSGDFIKDQSRKRAFSSRNRDNIISAGLKQNDNKNAQNLLRRCGLREWKMSWTCQNV